MVIRSRNRAAGGWIFMDLGIAMVLILFAVLPLAFAFSHEQKLARAYYFRAVAGQIADGELERLTAGEWRRYPQGVHLLNVQASAATNLPPGKFEVTVQTNFVQVEWLPDKRGKGGRILRRANL